MKIKVQQAWDAKKAARKLRSYPTDISNEEWEFCVSYLTLIREAAPQRERELRAIFNALALDGAGGLPVALAAQ